MLGVGDIVAVNVATRPDIIEEELDVIDVVVDTTGGVNVIEEPGDMGELGIVLFDIGFKHGTKMAQPWGTSPT